MGAGDSEQPAGSAAPPPEELAERGRWDLTARLGTCLDRHLVFPLLEFLQARCSSGGGSAAVLRRRRWLVGVAAARRGAGGAAC
jgi:hypothetical protein